MNHSGITDSGTYFEIVPNTRKVIVPAAYKVIGTVDDHLSEQLTFRCPRLIDGHDIEGCARHYVTWENVNGTVGHDDLILKDSDAEYLYFTWSIRNGLAVAAGLVSFSVHFEDVDTNDKICYRWSTTTCDTCEILDSINAVLNAYEAVYIAGDTLVFDDYTLVKDKTLAIETNGLIPEGTIKISRNGEYHIGKYASAEVAVNPPSGTIKITQNGSYDVTNYAEASVELPADEFDAPEITVSETGKIKAVANGVESTVQLSSEHDGDLIPENIRAGVNIFGVTGTVNEWVSGTITNHGSGPIQVWYFNGRDTLFAPPGLHIAVGDSYNLSVIKNSPIILVATSLLQPFGTDDVFKITGGSILQTAADGSMWLVKATDDFQVERKITFG